MVTERSTRRVSFHQEKSIKFFDKEKLNMSRSPIQEKAFSDHDSTKSTTHNDTCNMSLATPESILFRPGRRPTADRSSAVAQDARTPSPQDRSTCAEDMSMVTVDDNCTLTLLDRGRDGVGSSQDAATSSPFDATLDDSDKTINIFTRKSSAQPGRRNETYDAVMDMDITAANDTCNEDTIAIFSSGMKKVAGEAAVSTIEALAHSLHSQSVLMEISSLPDSADNTFAVFGKVARDGESRCMGDSKGQDRQCETEKDKSEQAHTDNHQLQMGLDATGDVFARGTDDRGTPTDSLTSARLSSPCSQESQLLRMAKGEHGLADSSAMDITTSPFCDVGREAGSSNANTTIDIFSSHHQRCDASGANGREVENEGEELMDMTQGMDDKTMTMDTTQAGHHSIATNIIQEEAGHDFVCEGIAQGEEDKTISMDMTQAGHDSVHTDIIQGEHDKRPSMDMSPEVHSGDNMADDKENRSEVMGARNRDSSKSLSAIQEESCMTGSVSMFSQHIKIDSSNGVSRQEISMLIESEVEDPRRMETSRVSVRETTITELNGGDVNTIAKGISKLPVVGTPEACSARDFLSRMLSTGPEISGIAFSPAVSRLRSRRSSIMTSSPGNGALEESALSWRTAMDTTSIATPFNNAPGERPLVGVRWMEADGMEGLNDHHRHVLRIAKENFVDSVKEDTHRSSAVVTEGLDKLMHDGQEGLARAVARLNPTRVKNVYTRAKFEEARRVMQREWWERRRVAASALLDELTEEEGQLDASLNKAMDDVYKCAHVHELEKEIAELKMLEGVDGSTINQLADEKRTLTHQMQMLHFRHIESRLNSMKTTALKMKKIEESMSAYEKEAAVRFDKQERNRRQLGTILSMTQYRL